MEIPAISQAFERPVISRETPVIPASAPHPVAFVPIRPNSGKVAMGWPPENHRRLETMTRHTERRGHRRRFVATNLARLPPGTYTDPGQTGLQLRVIDRPDGKPLRSWLLRYKYKGKGTRILLGHFPEKSLDAARTEARYLREQADQGIDPKTERQRRRAVTSPLPLSSDAVGSKHSIEFLASEYMERHVRRQLRRPEYVQAMLAKDVLPEWRGRDARSIKPREVVELLDKVAARAPVMANRVASILGQMFRHGIHRAIVEDSPVKLLYRPGGKEKARARVLTDAELAAFVANPKACTRYQRLASAMMVLLLTAQRRGELALARWSEIDFTAQTWTIPDANAKTGRGHVVPLTDWAIAELHTLQRMAKGSPWVLPANGGAEAIDPRQLSRGVAKNQQRFIARGVQPFVLHDLRRTARTGMAKLGVEPHIAERVLNHLQPGVAGVYDRAQYLDEKRNALTKWAEHLKNLSRAKSHA
jgi:integrase